MNKQAQTAMEYMLIMGTVMVIVLTSWKVFLPSIQNSSDLYFNRVNYGIVGAGPRCGNGKVDYPENIETCCIDYPGACVP